MAGGKVITMVMWKALVDEQTEMTALFLPFHRDQLKKKIRRLKIVL